MRNYTCFVYLRCPMIFLWSLLFFCVAVWESHGAGQRELLTIMMPEVGAGGVKHNDYMCHSVQLQPVDSYIVQFEPRVNPHVVHHMLLFGCPHKPNTRQSWSCKSNYLICGGARNPQILFAWALNASGLHLPDEVGLEIGPSHDINYAVLQIHYGHPEAVSPEALMGEHEALVLHLTQEKQPFIAGIYILGSMSTITAGKEAAHVDTACKFGGPNPIHPFAFRTHAHSLGQVIAGYVVKNGNKEDWELIGSRSPQDAQAFYPAANSVTVNPGDWLAARCVFNTRVKAHSVHMGANSEDEMCNFYIMYYMVNNGQSLIADDCWNQAPSAFRFPELHVPEPVLRNGIETEADHNPDHTEHDAGNGDETAVDNILSEIHDIVDEIDGESPTTKAPPLVKVTHPPAPITKTPPQDSTPAERLSNWPFFEGGDRFESDQTGSVESGRDFRLELAEDWPLNGLSSPDVGGITLGQVTAVAVDHAGFVHIFHRGPTVWDYGSFSSDNRYQFVQNGPIDTPTLLKFSSSGELLSAWGRDLFYMPHGLTVDRHGNFWITDVAMHQVLKFSSEGDVAPSMRLGKPFQPGHSLGYFCQPASVAVEDSGIFYVADGYCNRRVLKFNADGKFLQEWDQFVDGRFLYIPHSVTFSKAQNRLFVADRQNGRIVSYNPLSESGEPEVFAKGLTAGGKWGSVYAISFNGTGGWPLYAIGGPTKENREYRGHVVSQSGERSISWRPSVGFSLPHDLAVDPVSGAVYVAEIHPNRIWKFIPVSHPVPSLENPDVLLTTTQPTATTPQATHASIATGLPDTADGSEVTEPSSQATHATVATGLPDTTGGEVTEPTAATKDNQSPPAAITSPPMVSTNHTVSMTTPNESTASHTVSMTTPTESTASHTVSTTTPTESTTSHTVSMTTTNETASNTVPMTTTNETASHAVSTTTSTESASQPSTPFGQQDPDLEQNRDKNETLHESSTGTRDPPTPGHHKTPVYKYGIIAAVIVVTIAIFLLIIGLHQASRWCSLSFCNRRRYNSYKELSTGTRRLPKHAQAHPRDRLHSLLGPSRQGFSRVQNLDSDSEVDEFPIFSRV